VTPADFQHGTAQIGEVRLHYVRAGQGTPVLLVHGWPQTWYEWHRVIPHLVETGNEVIAVDMRGAGDSSRPAGGYDSNSVAADLHGLVQHLGFKAIRLVGHDNGGRVCYAFAANYRDAVTSLTFLESKILGVESDDDATKEFWHFGFHQEPDLPELLLTGREREYFSYFYKRYSYDSRSITSSEIDEFVRCYTSLGGMRAGFAFYRAFPETAAQSRVLAQTKLTIPVLAFGGSHCMGDTPLRSMQRVAENVQGGIIPQCGHWIPDERPEWIAREISRFHHGCLS